MCAEQGGGAKATMMTNSACGDVPREVGKLCAHEPESHKVRKNDALEKFVLNDLHREVQ